VVLARGVIVDSGRVNFKSGKRTASFYVTTDFRYAPYFQVVAYYVANNGILVADGRYVSFQQASLPNYVSLILTKKSKSRNKFNYR
jgi:Alpha-2-macroglobulin bait region domain